jgi:hypothetical protein
MPVRTVAISILCAAVACGGDSGTTSPGGTSGGTSGGASTGFHITAKIDGTAWTSTAGSEHANIPSILPGLYTFTGAQFSGSAATNYIIAVTLYDIAGPGTYPLGVGPTTPGGSVILSNTTGGWATPQSGADGSITITTLTSTRMTGTFNVTVGAATGSATGTKTITDGDFDLEVKQTGTVGPLPDNAGSKVSATIGGTPWNGASVAAQYSSTNGTFVIAATNSTRGFGITLTGVTGPGTYALTNVGLTRTMNVGNVVNTLSNTWNSIAAGSSGSVTITSFTSTRVKGTFNGILGPVLSTPASTLSVTGGTFDVGLP